MSFTAAAAMPPLLVRASRTGEHAPDVLLASWLPLDRPLEGRLWCDVASPADNHFGNHVDFPAGCDASQAIEAILKPWQGRPDPVAAWLDGERPGGETALTPPSPLTQDGNGKPVPHATLSKIPGSRGRMFRVTGEPGATLLLNDEASRRRARTIVAKDGHIACLRRTRWADPEWIVIPGLGPVGTYWAFADHNKFAAMAAVATYLAETHAEGGAPDDALAVLAHAALVLRYLGPAFRERAVGILARSPSEDPDVIALTWCLPIDGVGRDCLDLSDLAVRMCQSLQARHPTYAATLECIWPRIGRSCESRPRGGPYGAAMEKIGEILAVTGKHVVGGHATIVLER